MTFNRSPSLSNNDGAAVAAVGCIGCLIFVAYFIGVIIFISLVVWAVVSVLQWTGVL